MARQAPIIPDDATPTRHGPHLPQAPRVAPSVARHGTPPEATA